MAYAKTLFSAAALGLAAIAPFSGAASATITGGQLYAMCTSNMGGSGNPMLAAECMGYVVGVSDTFDCVEKNHGYTWNSSAMVSQPHLVTVVLQWLDTHKDGKNTEAHKVVGAALQDAYPCKK
jgi:hypothetical protein